MNMPLITKELAEAVVKFGHRVSALDEGLCYCAACRSYAKSVDEVHHDATCIIGRAKLLLELEWGIKS